MLEGGRLRCARSSYSRAYSHPHPAQHPFAHASACARTFALKHGMCVAVCGKLAMVCDLSYFTCCICAAFVGVRFGGCRLLVRGMRRCEAPMGTGEALPHLAPLHCPPARVFAHHCIARMCALQSHALFALPSCVIAALMLCVCVVRRRSMWCNRAFKAASWEYEMQLARAGMGRVAGWHACTPMPLMRTLSFSCAPLVSCVLCGR